MSYNAEILADSIAPSGDRITTMKVTFPRMMLAEMNTHRMFSRNSASSRAIPFKKMVKMVEENPFIPIAWQKDHKGMQGTEYFQGNCREEFGYLDRSFKGYGQYKDKSSLDQLKEEWLEARDNAVQQAKVLNYLGVTKQLCNRLLEPFMWHEVIITATEFSNFFKLRCPQYTFKDEKLGIEEIYHSKKDAIEGGVQPETGNALLDWLELNKSQADIHIQAIAELMWNAYNESEPRELKAGEWHIPFGDQFDFDRMTTLASRTIDKEEPEGYKEISDVIDLLQIKIAVARCARISYQTLGDNPKVDYQADLRLHDILAESGHWSPFEHVAKAMTEEEYYGEFSKQKGKNNIESGWCRNFRGFVSYRSLLDD